MTEKCVHGQALGSHCEGCAYDEKKIERINALVTENARLRSMLEHLSGPVCDFMCPEKWRSDEQQPHSDECKNLRALLAEPSDLTVN